MLFHKRLCNSTVYCAVLLFLPLQSARGQSWSAPIDLGIQWSDDRNPVLTQSGFHLWAYWQTSRDGDWDIYGRFIDMNYVEEFTPKDLKESEILTLSPNPFCDFITINWHLPDQYSDFISVFDISGREVKRLNINGQYGKIKWFGDDQKKKLLPNGVYFLTIGDKTEQKVVILR
jgi:hypothetical protein